MSAELTVAIVAVARAMAIAIAKAFDPLKAGAPAGRGSNPIASKAIPTRLRQINVRWENQARRLK